MYKEALESNARPGIYTITHTTSGKQYIGQAFNLSHRFATHRYELRRNHHHSPHLQRAWNKYGPDAFTFTVLEYIEAGDRLRERLTEREQHHMDVRYAAKGSHEYNVAPAAGSQLGLRWCPESLAQVSEIRKGHAWHAGYHHTPEAREKMRQRKLGHASTPAQRAALERGHVLARSGVITEKQREATRQWNLRRRGLPWSDKARKGIKERTRGLLAYNKAKSQAAQEGRLVLTERQKAANAARRGRPITEKQRAAYDARCGRKQSPEQITRRLQTMRERGHHPSQRDYSSVTWQEQNVNMVERSVATRRRKAQERCDATQPPLFQ